jgi:hypothetical protein
MKYLLLICAAAILSQNMQAQSIAMADPQYVQFHFMDSQAVAHSHIYKEKCTATQVGKYVMIGGAGVAVLGGIALGTSFADNWDKNHLGTDTAGNPVSVGNGKKFCTAITVAGASAAVVGALMYLAGRETDRKNRRHLSIISEQHKLGMAYNLMPHRRSKMN